MLGGEPGQHLLRERARRYPQDDPRLEHAPAFIAFRLKPALPQSRLPRGERDMDGHWPAEGVPDQAHLPIPAALTNSQTNRAIRGEE